MQVFRPFLWLFPLAFLCLPCSADMSAADVSVGGDIRLRAEGFDNILDLEDRGDSTLVGEVRTPRNDDYEYFRFRTRLWLTASPNERLDLFFRVGNEYRFGRGENTSGVKDPESKLSIDNAWARVSRRRMSLTFGRMDLQYGEGFLVFDGTPADGSASAWFDAIKLSVARPMGTLDVFYAQIDEEGFGGPSRDEDLVGVYGAQHGIDTYVLHRTKLQQASSSSGAIRPRGSTTALGVRLDRALRHGLSLVAEGAYERGEVEDQKREAYGGYGRLALRGGGRLSPRIELGGLYLSGDDPDTERYEGWDGFYGEWPKYSELLVYTLYDNTSRISPNEPGTWTNLAAGWLEARMGAPMRQVVVRIMPLRAAERGTGPGPGIDRGILMTGRVDVGLSEGLTAQLLGELFDPGDFYAQDADLAWYARCQLVASF